MDESPLQRTLAALLQKMEALEQRLRAQEEMVAELARGIDDVEALLFQVHAQVVRCPDCDGECDAECAFGPDHTDQNNN